MGVSKGLSPEQVVVAGEELQVELGQRHDLAAVVLPQRHKVLVPQESLVRVQRQLVHLCTHTAITKNIRRGWRLFGLVN